MIQPVALREKDARAKPILFSAPMVRAILDGRKTQTRRVVKPQPRVQDGSILYPFRQRKWNGVQQTTIALSVTTESSGIVPLELPIIMRYAVGDRLWVRETWGAYLPGDIFGKGAKDAWYIQGQMPHEVDEAWIVYRADGENPDAHWKPSIFMPRWASRITLEVTGVRVERLQDISEADAIAEGCTVSQEDSKFSVPGPIYRYQQIWESINVKGSWEANPWVEVYEFRRVA